MMQAIEKHLVSLGIAEKFIVKKKYFNWVFLATTLPYYSIISPFSYFIEGLLIIFVQRLSLFWKTITAPQQ